MASYNYVCIVRLAIHSIPHEIKVGWSYMGTMLNFVKFEKYHIMAITYQLQYCSFNIDYQSNGHSRGLMLWLVRHTINISI